MGYRDRSTNERSGAFSYSIMEVRLRKKGAPESSDDVRYITVDNHWDTLHFVQDNMNECVGNIVRLKRVEESADHGVNESARLFQRNLEPLVTSLAATQQGHGVMDKLSASLKKALLLMVMERYQSDREKACQVLGISREKLETELQLCGVTR